MSKNSLKKLQTIIRRLTPDERSILESYLTGFQSQYGKYESKYLQLYREISDISKEPDEEEIRKKVSPDVSLDAFQKTAARLKDKIFDSLLLDFNIFRKGSYSKPTQISYKLRKQFIQVQILHTRGLTDEAKEILEKGYKECCSYYYYQEAVSYLQLLYTIENRGGKLKRVQALEAELQHVRALRNITEKSELYFSSIGFREYYQGNPETYISELRFKIADLESEPKLKSSVLAYYYYLYLKVFYHKAKKEYSHMEFHAREILHVLLQNPNLQSKPRIINGYLLLTDANVYNGEHAQALGYIDRSLKELIPGNKNYSAILLHKCMIMLYAGQTSEAQTVIESLLRQADNSRVTDAVSYNKLLYYKAIVHLLQGDAAAAYKVMRQVTSFHQDKEGWNINVRILQIMIMIENEYLDEADQEIENFRKTLSNIIKSQPVSKRNILIFRLLTWLSKKDFDFGRVYKDHAKLIGLLFSDDPELRWDFLTPEVMPFHSWFKLKADKNKIDHDKLYIMPPVKVLDPISES